MITTHQGYELSTGADLDLEGEPRALCVGCEHHYYHGPLPDAAATFIDGLVLWGDELYCHDCFGPLPDETPEMSVRDYLAEVDDAQQEAYYNRRKDR